MTSRRSSSDARRRVAHAVDLLVERAIPSRYRCRCAGRRLRAGSSRSRRRNTRPRCPGRSSSSRRRAAPPASCSAPGSAPGAARSAMTCAMVKVLPEPVTPSSTWSRSPRREARDQLVDRLRLVAGRLELRHEAERLRGLGIRLMRQRRLVAGRITQARIDHRIGDGIGEFGRWHPPYMPPAPGSDKLRLRHKRQRMRS